MKSRIVRVAFVLGALVMLAAIAQDRFIFAERFVASRGEDSVAAAMTVDAFGAGRLVINDSKGQPAFLVESGKVRFAEVDEQRSATEKVKKLQAEVAALTARLAAVESSVGLATPVAPAPVNTPPAPNPQPAPAAPTQVNPPAKAFAQQVYRAPDFDITLTDVRVRKVESIHSNGPSADDGVVVTLQITNKSKTWKMPYTRWQGLGADRARLLDNLQNEYKRLFEYAAVKGGVSDDRSLYPGESMTEILAYERPVPNAKEFAIMLPLTRVGGQGEAVFKFKLP